MKHLLGMKNKEHVFLCMLCFYRSISDQFQAPVDGAGASERHEGSSKMRMRQKSVNMASDLLRGVPGNFRG